MSSEGVCWLFPLGFGTVVSFSAVAPPVSVMKLAVGLAVWSGGSGGRVGSATTFDI